MISYRKRARPLLSLTKLDTLYRSTLVQICCLGVI